MYIEEEQYCKKSGPFTTHLVSVSVFVRGRLLSEEEVFGILSGGGWRSVGVLLGSEVKKMEGAFHSKGYRLT